MEDWGTPVRIGGGREGFLQELVSKMRTEGKEEFGCTDGAAKN